MQHCEASSRRYSDMQIRWFLHYRMDGDLGIREAAVFSMNCEQLQQYCIKFFKLTKLLFQVLLRIKFGENGFRVAFSSLLLLAKFPYVFFFLEHIHLFFVYKV